MKTARNFAITSRCAQVSFSLAGEETAEFIEGVETFKYLRRMLDRSDDDWKVVLWVVSKAR